MFVLCRCTSRPRLPFSRMKNAVELTSSLLTAHGSNQFLLELKSPLRYIVSFRQNGRSTVIHTCLLTHRRSNV